MVNDYSRKNVDQRKMEFGETPLDTSWVDRDGVVASTQEEAAEQALEEMIEWLAADGQVNANFNPDLATK